MCAGVHLLINRRCGFIRPIHPGCTVTLNPTQAMHDFTLVVFFGRRIFAHQCQEGHIKCPFIPF